MTNMTDPSPSTGPYGGNENHFARLVAIIPGMLYDYVLNPDGSSTFLYVGPKCREILELTEQELLSDAGHFWALVLPEDLDLLKSADVSANREGVDFTADVRIRTRSGCLKWIQLSSRPNPALPGELVVWSGFMLDITQRKQTEAELSRSQNELKVLNEQLELRVAERTTDLENTLQALKESRVSLANSEARATLSTMIAGLSHELSTPLGNSLMANSTIADSTREFQTLMVGAGLKRTDMTKFVGLVDQGVGMVESNLLRANELLKNFRQVAADQASEQRRHFDLAQMVKEVVHTMGPSLKRYPHRVVVDVEHGIDMDSQPGPLGQVVINLINNAYLHAFEGVAKGVLTIEARSDDGWVDMRIRDNGVGIPPENLEKIFQAFFSTKIGKGGTGLGMAIVQNLVTNTLCGSVDVVSTIGEGTEFRIRLPIVLPMNVPIG